MVTTSKRNHKAPTGTTARLPRYLDLAAEMVDSIRRGVHAVGSQFPSEHEWCERYGVSRFTVRAALETLRRQGYVSRRPKIGTLVIADRPVQRFSVHVTGTAELLSLPSVTDFRPLGVHDFAADETLSQDLGCTPGEPWVRVEGCQVTRSAERIVSLVDYYLHPEHRKALVGLEGAGPRALPLHTRIERAARQRITEVHRKISAQPVPRRQARSLAVPEGSTAFRLAHKIFGSDVSRPLYAVMSLVPAAEFSFTQTLQLET